MSDSIIIRKAKQDYVCSCCGHVIHKGDEYLDKVILNVGKIVKHDRYHDECPEVSDTDKLFKKILTNKGDLIAADKDGNKIHIIGIKFINESPKVIFRPWDKAYVGDMDFRWLDNLHDEKGDKLI